MFLSDISYRQVAKDQKAQIISRYCTGRSKLNSMNVRYLNDLYESDLKSF